MNKINLTKEQKRPIGMEKNIMKTTLNKSNRYLALTMTALCLNISAGPGDDENSITEDDMQLSAPTSPGRRPLARTNLSASGNPDGLSKTSRTGPRLGALRELAASEDDASSTTSAAGSVAPSAAYTHLTGVSKITGLTQLTDADAAKIIGQNVSLQQKVDMLDREISSKKAKLEKLQNQMKKQKSDLAAEAQRLLTLETADQIKGIAKIVRTFGYKFKDPALKGNIDTLYAHTQRMVTDYSAQKERAQKYKQRTAEYAALVQDLAEAIISLTGGQLQVEGNQKPAGTSANLKYCVEVLKGMLATKEQETQSLVRKELDALLLKKEDGVKLAPRASAAQLREYFGLSGRQSEYSRTMTNVTEAIRTISENNGMFGAAKRSEALKTLAKELSILKHVKNLVSGSESVLKLAEEHDPSSAIGDQSYEQSLERRRELTQTIQAAAPDLDMSIDDASNNA
jgi:hypothetical protein